MKVYFEQTWNDIKEDAVRKFPEESCGLIVDGKYISCENKAIDKNNEFSIDDTVFVYHSTKGNVQAIVHSHNDYPHISKRDMERQQTTALPWGIVNLKNGNIMSSVLFWGDQLETQDLIGRPFFHGLYDCYSLCRDYYKGEFIYLPDFSRELEWWLRGESLYDNFVNVGFDRISRKELKEGDSIMFQIRSPVVNHAGIYLGNGLILHHLINRLSRREPVGPWLKYATHFLRYIG